MGSLPWCRVIRTTVTQYGLMLFVASAASSPVNCNGSGVYDGVLSNVALWLFSSAWTPLTCSLVTSTVRAVLVLIGDLSMVRVGVFAGFLTTLIGVFEISILIDLRGDAAFPV